MKKETENLGVPNYYKGVVPHDTTDTNGFYELEDGVLRLPHRLDGRPSQVDFLPAGTLDNQTIKEELIMAMPTSPGATLGKQNKHKGGLDKNLTQGQMPRAKAPAPGNNLK